MVRANFQLAHAAWTRRRSDPIGPHASLYLYANGGTDLRLAYRTFVAADEPRLPHLLHDLIPHVRAQLTAGADVRQAQCTAVEDMHRDASYLGLAVASLDTPTGTWDEVVQTAYSELHIPGRSYVWLIDDTVMVIDRFAHDRFGRVTVYSNRPARGLTGEMVTVIPDLGDPHRQSIADPDVLTYLRELHHTVAASADTSTYPSGGRHAH
jgi:hypothetical protein